jgi:hypothetical protein
MHLDADQLTRYADGELSVDELPVIRRHLAECASCTRAAATVRDDIAMTGRRLSALDHRLPAVTAPQIMARARQSTLRTLLRAAAAVGAVVLAAGAVYAAPGSPLRGWLQQITGEQRAPVVVRDTAVDAPAPGAAASPTGIAVAPGSTLTVSFRRVQRGGLLRIRIVDAATVSVRALQGGATFVTAEDELSVENTEAANDYGIDIPQRAARVEVRLAGRVVFLKQGTDIVTEAAAGSDGSYVLPLDAR